MARRRIELRLRAYEAQAPNHGPRDEINVGGSGGGLFRNELRKSSWWRDAESNSAPGL